MNKADYDQAIFYGRQLFEIGYNERDYNGAVIYSHICLGQAHMMKGNVKEAYSHLGQARLIGESNKMIPPYVLYIMVWDFMHRMSKRLLSFTYLFLQRS